MEPVVVHQVVIRLDQKLVREALGDFALKLEPSLKDSKALEISNPTPWNFVLLFTK